MTMRIILVRHGRSAHVQTGWIDRTALLAWRRAYDEAGILSTEVPPPALLDSVSEGGLVVSSDLPRARASAALLAPEFPIVTSCLLREADMTIPSNVKLPLPLFGWALVIGVQAVLSGLRLELPPVEIIRRAETAAEWLRTLAAEHCTVVAVTHATFRRHLARALCAHGWRHERPLRRYHHWSAWTLTSSPTVDVPNTTPSAVSFK